MTTPMVELSTDGGKSWAQLELTSPGPNTVVTALTASGSGFTAAGQYGQPQARRRRLDLPQRGELAGQRRHRPRAGGQNEIAALASSGTTVTGIGSIQTQQSQESVILTLHGH